MSWPARVPASRELLRLARLARAIGPRPTDSPLLAPALAQPATWYSDRRFAERRNPPPADEPAPSGRRPASAGQGWRRAEIVSYGSSYHHPSVQQIPGSSTRALFGVSRRPRSLPRLQYDD